MARLFITPREIDLISDLTKEIMKDIIGQKIYYYSVSDTKSKVHEIYNEAPEKIFDNPVDLDALVEWEPSKMKVSEYGAEDTAKIKLWVHARDLLDKQLQLSAGDFFSFGDIFFEIIQFLPSEVIYGQIEHKTGYQILGVQARRTQFLAKIFGPTEEKYSDADAVQNTFVQQRGQPENRLGPTGDVRELQKKQILDAPLDGPKEVSPKGSDSRANSAFYDE